MSVQFSNLLVLSLTLSVVSATSSDVKKWKINPDNTLKQEWILGKNNYNNFLDLFYNTYPSWNPKSFTA